MPVNEECPFKWMPSQKEFHYTVNTENNGAHCLIEQHHMLSLSRFNTTGLDLVYFKLNYD